VDFSRDGSWRASVANYAHRRRHCLAFAALSGKLKFPFHHTVLCGQILPSRCGLEFGHPDARFVDTHSCEFAFFLHLFLVYRWCANAASGVGDLFLYGWSFGVATRKPVLSGFAAMEAKTGPGGRDGAIEVVTLY